MAISAPMMDVLAEMPSDTISCMPIIAPKTDSPTDTSSRKGSVMRARVAGLATRDGFIAAGAFMVLPFIICPATVLRTLFISG